MSPILNNIVNTIVKSAAPERIVLFGSRSRRNHRSQSDYDFIVIKKGVKNERDVSRRIYKALFKKKIPQAVDIVVIDSRKLETHQYDSSLIYSSALKEGKVLYG